MSFTSRTTDEKQDDLKQELEMLLADAVERSISHNEIVKVDFYGDRASLIEMLESLDEESDIEWVELDGVVDVWACDLGTEEGMTWRLDVTCAG